MTLTTGDVGKMLGEKWKSLSDAQKGPYEKKAAADKKRYEDEKAAYQAVSLYPSECCFLWYSLTFLIGRCRRGSRGRVDDGGDDDSKVAIDHHAALLSSNRSITIICSLSMRAHMAGWSMVLMSFFFARISSKG